MKLDRDRELKRLTAMRTIIEEVNNVEELIQSIGTKDFHITKLEYETTTGPTIRMSMLKLHDMQPLRMNDVIADFQAGFKADLVKYQNDLEELYLQYKEGAV